jgi:hypothetical protein
MPPGHRRTATRVRDGRVQKKNNWELDRGDYFALEQDEIRLDRRPPGRGYRHLLTIADVRAFIALLPAWDEVAIGLDAIVLDAGSGGSMGWHRPGIVAVRAWEHELWWPDCPRAWERDSRHVLDRIGVEREPDGDSVALRWTEAQARAFQLLDVLPHELGHHHDRITTRGGVRAARGEPYAEAYALRVMDEIWPAYADRFGV